MFSADRHILHIVIYVIQKSTTAWNKIHPHVTVIAKNVAKETITDKTKPFHCPNTDVIHPSRGLSISECSCISLDNVWRPSRALVTEPSAAILLGMKVQHIPPNITQTHPFSVKSQSILNCHEWWGTQLFGQSLHRIPSQLGQPQNIVMDVINLFNILIFSHWEKSIIGRFLNPAATWSSNFVMVGWVAGRKKHPKCRTLKTGLELQMQLYCGQNLLVK